MLLAADKLLGSSLIVDGIAKRWQYGIFLKEIPAPPHCHHVIISLGEDRTEVIDWFSLKENG